MKKITEMTRPAIKAMRPEIEAALEEFAKSLGLEISLGNASYMANEVSFKLTAKISGAETQGEKLLSAFGYKAGQIVTCGSLGKVRLVEYKQRNRKYPFIVETMGAAGKGKRYKVSERQITA